MEKLAIYHRPSGSDEKVQLLCDEGCPLTEECGRVYPMEHKAFLEGYVAGLKAEVKDVEILLKTVVEPVPLFMDA